MFKLRPEGGRELCRRRETREVIYEQWKQPLGRSQTKR